MDQKIDKPSIARILWTDYVSFYAAIILGMIWAIYLAWVPAWRSDGPIVPPSFAPYVLLTCIIVTVVCLSFLGWRMWMIWTVFRNGDQVRGRITSVYINRDRGKVAYVYVFKGEEYRSSAIIHRNKETKALKKGEKLILMVDRINPQRAFIRHLYV